MSQELLGAAQAVFSALKHQVLRRGLWSCVAVESTAEGTVFAGWSIPPYGAPGETSILANGRPLPRHASSRVDVTPLARFELALPYERYTFEVMVPPALLHHQGETVLTCEYPGAGPPRSHHQVFWSGQAPALPSAADMRRTTASTSADNFTCSGYTNARHFELLLAEHYGRSSASVRQVLDWGCGSGRVLRFLIDRWAAECVGVDIDPANVEACQRYLRAQIQRAPLRPPLQLPSSSFDFVYGISVMTHLSEADQLLWLEELARVTLPGAAVILTVHGAATFFQGVNDFWTCAALTERGFVDVGASHDLDATSAEVKESDYYRNVFNTERNILEHWSRWFTIKAILHAGVVGLQDYVLLERRSDGA